MLRACIDTNVWLSGIMFTGTPAKVVDCALKRKFDLVSSSFILDELERNLVNKFEVKAKDARRLRYRIAQVATLFEPAGSVKVLDDDNPDNNILETAWRGRARYLVTGDRNHLLPLKMFKHTKIVDPATFLGALRVK